MREAARPREGTTIQKRLEASLWKAAAAFPRAALRAEGEKSEKERKRERGGERRRAEGVALHTILAMRLLGPINGPEASQAKTLPGVHTSLVEVVARAASGVDTWHPMECS